PTPSAAAEICTPSIEDAAKAIAAVRLNLNRSISQTLSTGRSMLDRDRRRLGQASPQRVCDIHRMRVDALRVSMRRSCDANQQARVSAIAGQRLALSALDPAAVLARGYSVISVAGSDTLVDSVLDLRAGMAVRAHLADGAFDAWVTSVSAPRNHGEAS
ncbi:MAG: exodeoxyribonuclease VII large subunit, partial [Thermomicrobiales bacterium]